MRFLRRARRADVLLQCTDGMSLIEVVVAMAIVTIALLPIMSMLPAQSMAQARAEQLTTATILAQCKMEELRTAFNADFQVPLQAGGIVSGGQASGDFEDRGYPKFRYSVQVTVARADVLHLLRVATWYDADDDGEVDLEEREVKLASQAARRRW